MSIPESGRHQQNSGEQFSSSDEAVSANRETDATLLEGVLRQTLSLLGPEKPLAVETTGALCRLVSRHKGRQFTLEPIAVELVSIVLTAQFQGLGPSQMCDGMAARVARTLYEDPQSRARLEAFWNRLGGG
jgi:hypothetical protein